MGEPRRSVKCELVPGEVLGKYEILRKLAVGGMAEIYLARIRGNAGFEKVVVLKRILPQMAEDPTFVQMFLEEARLAGTLNHPNIAHVYDVGEVDGQHFFTMEFVHGQDARSIRHEMKKREETVPLPVALAIIHGTAAALHYAHERTGSSGRLLGLVHRDVSASNVMVSYDGAIKLLDFGIARAATSAHKTQVGTLKGKVPYMSPEQCKGHPLDRRSDLFSLGIVMFEMTVGRRPFRGDSDFAIMDQIVYKGAPRPTSIQAAYPPALEAIVLKLLERDPKARYTTGEELIEDLDAFIQGNSLWVSPTKIGKYMRTSFADRIKAWEEAEQQGVSFAQHVAHSITSQSQRSELVTPPSSFPGLPSQSAEMAAVAPPGSPSQQIAAVAPPRRTSQPMAAQRVSEPMAAQRISESIAEERISEPTIPGPKMPLVAPPSAPVPVPQLYVPHGAPSAPPQRSIPHGSPSAPPQRSIPHGSPSAPLAAVESPVTGTAVPTLRPKSQRTILGAFAGALVLGAGVLGFSMMSSSRSSPPSGRASAAATTAPGSAGVMQATPPAQVPAGPAGTAAAAKAMAETKPAVAATEPETKPAVAGTTTETKQAVAGTTTETKPGEPKAETRPGETKAETQSADTQSAGTQSADTQSAEMKRTETQPAETKPSETKPAETRPAGTSPTGSTPPVAETKPETKPAVHGTTPAVHDTRPAAHETRPATHETRPAAVVRKPKPDKPKEQTWDPNSPFLPQ